MKALPACPSLYQINSHVWLIEPSRKLAKWALTGSSP
jgi:hypothetical protein